MKRPKFPADRIDPSYNPKGNITAFGIVLIILSFMIGGISYYLPQSMPIEPIVALSFGYFLLGIYVLILSKND